MVWQIWHEPSVNLSRHYKTGLAFFGELHRLGYRWHILGEFILFNGTAYQVPDILLCIHIYLDKKQRDN